MIINIKDMRNYIQIVKIRDAMRKTIEAMSIGSIKK